MKEIVLIIVFEWRDCLFGVFFWGLIFLVWLKLDLLLNELMEKKWSKWLKRF